MDLTRAQRLQAFLARLEGKPVVWGKDDCSATPALWVAEETGLRVDYPAYSTEAEALALKANAGGLVPIWNDRLSRIGIYERIGEPELGDVAVVETRLYGQLGGIVAQARILIIRKDNGGWHPFGPVRRFAKVWALPE